MEIDEPILELASQKRTLLETVFLANEYGVTVMFQPQSPAQTLLELRVVSDVAGLVEGTKVETLVKVTAMDMFKDPRIADVAIAKHIEDGLGRLRVASGAVG